MLVNTKARIGVFSIALGAYLPQFPSLKAEFEAQYDAFRRRLPETVELVDGGIVTTKELAQAAGDKFRSADVDLVMLQLLTYATSYNMLPAVRDLDVPVVLVNVQKKRSPDYENTDTATWLGELYACGAVGEMVADLERAGKRHAVITGVVEGGDPKVQEEIDSWCRAAQVRRRFRDTNLAQIGRPYPGMMDLYIDETNLYHRMFLYTKQFDWEKMWAIADEIRDEAAIHEKAQEILDTFDIEGGGTIEKVWEMAKYVVAFEQWVKDEQIAFIASHYDGFAQGKAGILDSMLIPAFSMLIKQGVACAVEGDIKVAMAMSILKTIAGMGQLSEMYSIDFEEDICIIGHSGSGDADISAKKPTMKMVPVFHGKTGGGYLTQFYPHLGPVTYLGITQDRNGNFKFVAAEGVNEPGPIFRFGDTNMRTRFSCGAREFCNRWSEAGPTHHMAAAAGRHIDTILKVGKIFNVSVDVIT
ncbi:arabinose isomerase [Lachnospiraceae bacterium WCA-9-b2]|uniref:Arabinose isomerase n=1 Tax=Sporofaciens musculi TaxID=2681861 RepID=A0A7X3SLK1_9FIRM|nr:arabinose isomerase [Sporofaciens musculi]MCI9422108.1 arabinose isomerase [Dorea sp.]MXP78744.1 arabinose isomerase [Sporofaciens musculi]